MASPTALHSSDFLDYLRLQGFEIGIDHYRRLHILLSEVGADVEPERLKTYLCPLFATSPEQQKTFYETYDRFYRSWTFPSEDVEREVPTPMRGASTPMSHRGRRERAHFELAILGMVIVVVIALIWGARLAGPRVRSREGPQTATSRKPEVAQKQLPAAPLPVESAPSPATTTGRTALLHRSWSGVWRWLAIVTPFVLFVIAEMVRRRRRKLVLRQIRARRPPFAWAIRAPSVMNPYALSSALRETALVLRDREPTAVERLALEPSIVATIAARGFPTLRYTNDTRPAEYLFLIERASFRDHQTRLFSELAEKLQREGVHVDGYVYDGDARICYPIGDGEPVLLANLRRSHPAHRLIIFGGGERLIDPIDGFLADWTELFMAWPDRAILTPEPPERWSVRERVLATEFMVLPATIDGLRTAVAIFRLPAHPDLGRSLGDQLSLPRLEPAIALEQLRAYLGDRSFRWLCACAVYPELHWELTLYLATLPAVGEGLIGEEYLLRLVRLPWFRVGFIPDEIRALLVDQLGAREMMTVREALVELLERQALPTSSLAADQHGLDLAVQRYAIAPRVRSTRRQLRRALERLGGKGEISDHAVVQLLDKVPQSRLVMQLPHRWRKMLFSAGVPALGWTTVGRFALAVMGASVLAALLWPRASARSSATSPAIAARSPQAALPRSPAVEPKHFDRADTIERGVEHDTALHQRAAITSPRSTGTLPDSNVVRAPRTSDRGAPQRIAEESLSQPPDAHPAVVEPPSTDTVTREDSTALLSREDSIRRASKDSAFRMDSARAGAEATTAMSAARTQIRAEVNDYLHALASRDTARVANLYQTQSTSDQRMRKSLLEMMKARMAVVDQHLDTIGVRGPEGSSDFRARLTWRTAFGAYRSGWLNFHAEFQSSGSGWVMKSCRVTGGLQ